MHRPSPIVVSLLLIAVVGCQQAQDSPRLAQMAEEAIHEQSAQNQRVSEAHANLTEGSKLLVEADANARRDLAQLQDKLRGDQAAVGQQRDALETERQTFAQQRRQDSAVGSSVLAFGILLACLAPLVLAGITLALLSRGSTQEEASEVLVEELVQVLGQDPSETGRLPALQADSERLPLPVEPR